MSPIITTNLTSGSLDRSHVADNHVIREVSTNGYAKFVLITRLLTIDVNSNQAHRLQTTRIYRETISVSYTSACAATQW